MRVVRAFISGFRDGVETARIRTRTAAAAFVIGGAIAIVAVTLRP